VTVKTVKSPINRIFVKCLMALLVILFCTLSVYAQQEADTVANLPGIEIETAVDRAEIYIGDLINYTLTITYDSTYELIPPPLGANLGAFDVKDYQSDIITRLPDGRIKSDNMFVLSTFTTGDYIIPPIPVIFNLPDSSRKVLLSEGVPIKVKSLLANAGDSVDVKPLKPPYEFKRSMTKYYLWGGIILTLLIIAGIFIWYVLRKKKISVEPVDLRPPWEIVFEKLAFLKEKNLPGQEKYKEYYVELTETTRFYLGRMYEVNVLDMTTEEFLENFRDGCLPEGLYDEFAGFLNHADLVKFAKFIPEHERAETDFSFIHDAVEKIRLDFERRQKAAAELTENKRVAGGVG